MPSLPSFSKTAGPPPAAPPKPTWDPRPVNVRPFPWLRPTIRIRLTLLYGGMFLMAGIVLLTIIYMLAADALHDGSALPLKILGGKFESTSDICDLPTQTSGQLLQEAVNSCLQHQRAVALNSLLNRSLLALLGLTVVAFAFGYAMAGRVLSPLGRITRTAQRVAGSDLHRRIELGGPDDELKELADTFDQMLDRLDRAFESQRRFVANASHELRT
ncbi:HAMP domain-containing protein, partial [Streptomyces platensis]